MDDLAAFARLIGALRPWLGDLVIVGGWAHRLHRFHPKAHPPAYEALRTRDADIAFSSGASLKGDIGAALNAKDFHEDVRGEHTPPVVHYRLGVEDQGFYAEFLAPLVGSGRRRNGTPDVTVATAGVTAQKLRWVDLLVTRPWVVELNETSGLPLDAPASVRVANPVSFIAQKLLIRKHREARKQAQDALYIHDTLDLFGPELMALRTLWLEGVGPALPPRTAGEIGHLCRDQFGAVTDVIREAARIPQDRPLPPERLQAACAYGLETIFGDA